MNVAFLFEDTAFGSMYGFAVMEKILGTGVLQRSQRQMRVLIGDILTYGVVREAGARTAENLRNLNRVVYSPQGLDLLDRHGLDRTINRSTVFAWVFQNMSAPIARELNESLTQTVGFLGAMDVDFSNDVHLHFFRNTLPEAYRLVGSVCSVFYSMGDNDDPDIAEREVFEANGFSVEYEDSGGRGTIFDNYDALDHFRRVEDFKRIFSDLDGLDEDAASDLALSLEELHPKLFDALAAAAGAIERAKTEEELAHAALSGRRFLEQLADYLFPPSSTPLNGRDVGAGKYKNRLWAYISDAAGPAQRASDDRLQILGKETDRLIDLFNSGLHSNANRAQIVGAFRDLVRWLISVIELDRSKARNPYLAYEDAIRELLLRGVSRRSQRSEGS